MEGCGEATTGRTADGSIIYAYRFNQGTPCDPAIGGPGVYPPLYGVVFPIDGRPPYHSETGLPYTGPIPGEFQSVPSGIAAAPTSGQQTAPDAGGKPAASFLGLPVHSSDLPAALQPVNDKLAAAVGGDGTIFGMSPLVAIGLAVGGFFLFRSTGGATNV